MATHTPWLPTSGMQLYDRRLRRLYVNPTERAQFIVAAEREELPIQSFCLTLAYTGCRISEALELTHGSLQLPARLITFRTLKRRDQLVMREVPIPTGLASLLAEMTAANGISTDRRLWEESGGPVHRVTAWRWVKAVMLSAGITGAQASPKGLRHGYGIHAIRSGVQLNMLSKWMGHADLATTAIYANASGPEELEIADRMW